MPGVYLGVGSNIERERYIVAGLDALAVLFGELALSSVYDSEAIGFEGHADRGVHLSQEAGCRKRASRGDR